MRSYFIAITIIIAAGAVYFAGKRLLTKRVDGETPVLPPPGGKQAEERKHPLTIEPAQGPTVETPVLKHMPTDQEPDLRVAGKDPLGISPAAGGPTDQPSVETVLKEAPPQEAQSIGQNVVSEEHQSPELAPAEGTIHEQPVIAEEIPGEPQEHATTNTPTADAAPETASPEQDGNILPVPVEPTEEIPGEPQEHEATNAPSADATSEAAPPEQDGKIPPVFVEPFVEIKKDSDDAPGASILETIEPAQTGMGIARVETAVSEPVSTESDEELDTEEEGAEENGGTVAGDEAPGEGGVALATRKKRRQVPRRFRPTGRAPAQAVPAEDKTKSGPIESGVRNRALPIEVRVVIERGGHCRVSLLPRRNDGLPETVLASGTGNPDELVALQEEWYQDVVHPDLGVLLQRGVEWEATDEEEQKIRWSLSGRDLFVLSRNDSLSGFISASRLVLGEEHIVLCTEGILREVQEAILLAGSPSPVMLGVSDGIPIGWVGLKGVVPRAAVASSAEGHILDALRPLAEVEIIMTGGIRIGRSAWLSGFPPNIRLRGDISAADEVLIDGRLASSTGNGSYTTPGWDTPGEHNVWCKAGQKTYRIQEGAEEWPAWDAYSWSHGETSGEDGRPHSVICGMLVLPAKIFRGHSFPILVPKSNCVLLGAAPGEIYTCSTRLELAARYCTGDPPFQPVWALPADSLGCDRDTVRILRVGEALPPEPVSKSPGRKQTARMRSWAAAVLNACRKGLRVDPSDPAAAGLWREYKRQAHMIRRSLR